MTELSSWKEDYEEIKNTDTEILAIGVDHIFSHNVFEASLGTLPYPLLSDWHKETVKKYGVFHEKDEVAVRSCFLIDKNGEIVYKDIDFNPRERVVYEGLLKECGKLSKK
ncbi:redoxin domain-containing protein [Rossellomorea vietnamensis]|uniref:Redoxin domain-containing protein n=1 Tax=Rossellomorea vietnamensis TaxID=218284 RepID=A0A5D4MHC7_9BACI|nr:redoxin domain-containing protein [Rossellomorea vietnamensis]